jgi:4-hydroxythreonine-4-phosphate dehydrogenase
MTPTSISPRIALTQGDPSGVGSEVIIKALVQMCDTVAADHVDSTASQFMLVGNPDLYAQELHRNFATLEHQISIVDQPTFFQPTDPVWYCLDISQGINSKDIQSGQVCAASGEIAYRALHHSIQLALANEIDAIVTAPLNKEALHQAGHNFPGHTEILAHECKVDDHAMMLYLNPGQIARGDYGLGIAHVTLHTSIASVPGLLSQEKILGKIHLMQDFLQRIGCEKPRIAVCALNPHAGEHGLFGNEEAEMIEPAVQQGQSEGIDVTGPFPADTVIKRAIEGEFDGVVAMYHDQGHIALKLIAMDAAVNITLGLPIIRTSPTHGTAFDIVGQGIARALGMNEAILAAEKLVRSRK